MSFYSRYVLPHVLEIAMRNKDLTRLRAAWIPNARGKVLEIGIGSGLNLRFYPAEVQYVYGVDPSLELQRFARKRVDGGRQVEFFTQRADARLPFADSSIDTVVSTWTLCTIPDVVRALQEMRRVLRPEGQFIFVEHGRSANTGTAAWQDRLTPIWKHIGGGCQLNRKIDDLISAAGFRITELKTEYLPGPRPLTYTYEGLAKKD